MTADQGRLTSLERRALLLAPLYRIVGMPVVALLGLLNTAIIVRETGAAVFGLISLIASLTLFYPFADLGIGSTVMSASTRLAQPEPDPEAVDVIRRAYHVLASVAAVLTLVALVVMCLDGWRVVIGFSSGPADRWAITVAVILFVLTIPGALGLRILVGLDRNPLVTLFLMSGSGFAVLITLGLYAFRVDGIWYATSSLGGLLAAELCGTWYALRLTGLGRTAFGRVDRPSSRLLIGSGWLLVMGIGPPAGLQAGRFLLSHLSTPEQLSRYGLMAQMYGICSTVLFTAGLAYWPVFVRRRSATDVTVRMWWRLTATFALVAVLFAAVLVVAAPPVADVLTGHRIGIDTALAAGFGALLIAQTAHLPSMMLLTKPNEARWQALWTLAMAGVGVGLGALAATRFGAVGVVLASALAIAVAQVLPDLAWVPRLVRRRPADSAA